MSDIKAGQVAVIRTTDEPVFILSTRLKQHNENPSDIATVRRPVMTENGIEHRIEDFYLVELESFDAKKKRMIQEYVDATTTQKAIEAQNKTASPDLFGN